jgi:hypothetical protein
VEEIKENPISALGCFCSWSETTSESTAYRSGAPAYREQFIINNIINEVVPKQTS